MKHFVIIFSLLFSGVTALASAAGDLMRDAYTDSFIFVEDGVEFAVYPSGEFDFFFNPDFRRSSAVHISTPSVNISYNSGYNYDPYVQYDDYGAVIQVEHVPIYYDYYGRIIQAGNVFIDYNHHGYVSRVGNLRVHYNRFHRFSHYTGYINRYNRNYVYRPWHRYYTRPGTHVSIVFNRPYRAFYQPHRLSYSKHVHYYNNNHHTYVTNHYYRPGHQVESYTKGRRTTQQREIQKVSTRRSSQVANRSNTRSSGDSDARRSASPNANRKAATSQGRSSTRENISRKTDPGKETARRSTARGNRNVSRVSKPRSINSQGSRATVRKEYSTRVNNQARQKNSSKVGRSVSTKKDTRVRTSTPARRSTGIRRSNNNSRKPAAVKAQERTRSNAVKRSSNRRSSARNVQERR